MLGTRFSNKLGVSSLFGSWFLSLRLFFSYRQVVFVLSNCSFFLHWLTQVPGYIHMSNIRPKDPASHQQIVLSRFLSNIVLFPGFISFVAMFIIGSEIVLLFVLFCFFRLLFYFI
jgi:hypothetical protein